MTTVRNVMNTQLEQVSHEADERQRIVREVMRLLT